MLAHVLSLRALRHGCFLLGLLVLIFAQSGCARPWQVDHDAVLSRIAGSYRQFFPAQGDPDLLHDSGLLRPRFGLPALLQPREGFTIELIERGGPTAVQAALIGAAASDAVAARCLQGALAEAPHADCFPLSIVRSERRPITGDAVLLRVDVQPQIAPPPGGYDLYVASTVDAPTRAPRAVWFRSEPPGNRPLRVAHLSDLHIGKGLHPELLDNLRRVLAEVDALMPDLVVITGDIANQGTQEPLMSEARRLLMQLHAPILVVLGNHDHGLSATPMLTGHHGSGWPNFARAFHPFLFFSVTLGDWEFVGFDSGPSELSARVLTRGLAPETLTVLAGELRRSDAAKRAGVVLFSHAPSRASLLARGSGPWRGLFGRMRFGAAEFETTLLRAAGRMRVLHLAGHTHWSDLYESRPAGEAGGERFVRWPASSLSPTLSPITGRVALITAQSATHTSFPWRQNGQGYGFTWLLLDKENPEVAFHRHLRGPARTASSDEKSCQVSAGVRPRDLADF